MYKFPIELLFWRVYVSGVIPLLVFTTFEIDAQDCLAMLLVFLILNFVLVGNQAMEKVMHYFYSQKYKHLARCFLTAIAFATVNTFAILTLFPNATPGVLLSDITAGLFLGFFGLVFIAKFLKIKSSLLCAKGDTNE